MTACAGINGNRESCNNYPRMMVAMATVNFATFTNPPRYGEG